MRHDLFAGISRYGQEMVMFTDGEAAGRDVKGFFQPLNAEDSDPGTVCSRAGQLSDSRYLVLLPANALDGGKKNAVIRYGGADYYMLRARFVELDGLSHWEGIFRLKGPVVKDV